MGEGWTQNCRYRFIELCRCGISRECPNCSNLCSFERHSRCCSWYPECLPLSTVIREALYHLWQWVWRGASWQDCIDLSRLVWRQDDRLGLLETYAMVHVQARFQSLQSRSWSLDEGAYITWWWIILGVCVVVCWWLLNHLSSRLWHTLKGNWSSLQVERGINWWTQAVPWW